jgi:hypothetical protein
MDYKFWGIVVFFGIVGFVAFFVMRGMMHDFLGGGYDLSSLSTQQVARQFV